MLIPGEELLIKGDTGDVTGKLLKRFLAWGSLNRENVNDMWFRKKLFQQITWIKLAGDDRKGGATRSCFAMPIWTCGTGSTSQAAHDKFHFCCAGVGSKRKP